MKILVHACRVERARPIIIDPGLYHLKKSGVFYAKERRSLPASFKLFMGKTPVLILESHCTRLMRKFSEKYVIQHFTDI